MLGIAQLTKKERDLLMVMLNPANREKNITAICKIADVSDETYRRAMKKPYFIEAMKVVIFRIIKEDIVPIVNAVIVQAKKGSFQHAKMLLEMIGLYKDQPLIQQVMQITNRNEIDEEELNRKIMDYFANNQQYPGQEDNVEAG